MNDSQKSEAPKPEGQRAGAPDPKPPPPAAAPPPFGERYERPTSPTLMLSAKPRSKALATVSLVLSFLGVVCAPLGLLGLFLGVFALGKISRGTAGGRGLAIGGTVLGALGLLVSVPLACAVAVPALMKPEMNVYERGAIGMLRSYSNAQSVYRRGNWDGIGNVYAMPFSDLHLQEDATGDPLKLIDARFAAAEGVSGEPRNGYLFKDVDSIGGEPINWVKDFALCAMPVDYGPGGRKTFVVRRGGAIWSRDQGPDGVFVVDFPSDPGREGWERVQ